MSPLYLLTIAPFEEYSLFFFSPYCWVKEHGHETRVPFVKSK